MIVIEMIIHRLIVFRGNRTARERYAFAIPNTSYVDDVWNHIKYILSWSTINALPPLIYFPIVNARRQLNTTIIIIISSSLVIHIGRIYFEHSLT